LLAECWLLLCWPSPTFNAVPMEGTGKESRERQKMEEREGAQEWEAAR
jgi:hypothetical protein